MAALGASFAVLVVVGGIHVVPSPAAQGDITTVAGQGSPREAGDNDLATQAQLNDPFGVSVDPGGGGLLVADRFGNTVRHVNLRTGVITRVAGSGRDVTSGDGGLATAAGIHNPTSAVRDSDGNLFIAEFEGNRIRKVDAATGIISTFAGAGGQQHTTGEGGPASGAGLWQPCVLRFGPSGDLYVSTYYGTTIRRVDHITGTITTVAGKPDEVDPVNPGWRSDGDGGPATRASISRGTGFTFTPAGDLVLTDIFPHTVRKVDHTTGIITTISGASGTTGGDGGPASAAGLLFPADVVADPAGRLFVLEHGDDHNAQIPDGNKVRMIDQSGIISTVAGSGTAGYGGDRGIATRSRLFWPWGLAIDTAGSLYIADTANNRVRKVAGRLPVVTGVDPASGPSAGGTQVTITGSGLTWATEVDLGSGVSVACGPGQACTSDDANPDTVLHVTVPAHAPGSVPVGVITPNGISPTGPSTPAYTWRPPVITDVSPDRGPATGGTQVTLSGTDLQGATVSFGGSAADPASVTVDLDGTSVTATTPPRDAAGPVDVSVSIPASGAATSRPGGFTYLPAITAILPGEGSLEGGTDVIVTGVGLSNADGARFGDDAARSFLQISSTQVVATSPAHASPEIVTLSVSSRGLASVAVPVGADQFEYKLESKATQVSIPSRTAGLSPGSTSSGSGPTGFSGGTGGGGLATAPAPGGFNAIAPAGVGTPGVTPTPVGAGTPAAAPTPTPAGAPGVTPTPGVSPGATPGAQPAGAPQVGAAGADRPAPRGAHDYLMVAGAGGETRAAAMAAASVVAGACVVAVSAPRPRRRRRAPAYAGRA